MKAEGETLIYSLDELPMEAVHFVSEVPSEAVVRWCTELPVDPGMRNILMWPDSEGHLHTLLFPRAAHRPDCYFLPESEGGHMVSPGAVDMAGVLVLPRLSDFKTLGRSDIRLIYNQVCLPYKDSPQFQSLMLS